VTVHAGPLALLFPSPAQRLGHIVVANLGDVTLTYEGTVLSSPARPLTRAGVAYALGPTFNDGTQRLTYPGLALEAAGGDRDDRVTSVSIMARDGDEPIGEDGLRKCSIKVGPPGLSLSHCYPCSGAAPLAPATRPASPPIATHQPRPRLHR
jgi:hypothetical protein